MHNVFLSTYDRGVHRAKWHKAEGWVVETCLPELEVTCLAQAPNAPGSVYAGTRGSGVWRSEDFGKTWQSVGLEDQMIMALAVSPHTPRRAAQTSPPLYAGTKPGHLFVSQDEGASWQELLSFREIPNRWWWFSPAEPPDWRPYISSIALSPTDAAVLLAGIEFGAVVRSEDGGQTWSRHLEGALRDCHALKFHPVSGEWVYEAGAGWQAGASVSRDGGRSWSKTSRGMAHNYGIVCAADPLDPETWYACVAPGPQKAFGVRPVSYLYRTRDSLAWEPIGWEEGPLSETPTALVTLPGEAGQLYAGLKNGTVWHSADHGTTWQKMPFTLGGIWFSLLVLSTN